MSAPKVKRILFGSVSGFLVYSTDAAILIDCGHRNTVNRFQSALKEAGLSPPDIKLIVLTHTHFDHAGGAREIKDLCGAPLAVHRNEAEFLRKGKTPFPRGTRWKGKLIASIGNIFFKRLAEYPSLDADIVVDDFLDLSGFGIPGRIFHSPGHTAGSLTVLLKNGSAFVGDNVLGLSKKEHFPPFANDEKEVLASWEKYIELGASMLFPAHGGRVPVEYLVSELPAAKGKYRQTLH